MNFTARLFLLVSLLCGSTAIAEVCQLYPIAISEEITQSAQEGDVFHRVPTGSGPGNYSFLSWTGANNTPTLANSLTPPGDFGNWINPDDSSDTTPDGGDWIQGGPGVKNARAIRDALDLLIGQDITVVEWSHTRGQGSNLDYQIARLIIIELTEYKLNGKGYFSWIYKGESLCGAPAVCEGPTLGLADDFNALIFGDFRATSSDTQGRMAIGGDLDLNHYSIADQLSSATAGTSVIVGGDFVFPSGRIYHGDILVGGTASLGDPVINGLSAEQTVTDHATLPIDFAAERANAEALSESLATLDDTGTVTAQWGGLYLVGDGSSPLQVFSLNGQEVLAAHTFDVSEIPSGSTIVFNIDGTNAGLTNMSLSSLEAHRRRVVFNFPEATNLTLSGISVEGSVLAPKASIDQPQGVIKGHVIAADWDGIMQLNHEPFAGCFEGLVSNAAPLAQDQTLQVPEDGAAQIVLTATDPDGDTLSFVVDTLPLNGTLSGNAPDLVYTPNTNYSGVDSFTFVADDGAQTSEVASILIEVIPVNDPPVADAKSASLNENSQTTILLTGADIDGDLLSFAIESGPANGVATIDGTALTYIPTDDFFGTDALTIRAFDGLDYSIPAPIDLTILAVNTPPVAQGELLQTTEDSPLPVTLLASDADGDSLTYQVIAAPSKGSLSGTAPNLVYLPDEHATGTDQFIFQVNDGMEDSNEATVTIEIEPVNDAPQANPASTSTPEDQAVNIVLSGSDVDGDPLTLALATNPGSGSVQITGAVATYTPNPDFSGSDSFTFIVNDGSVDSAPADVVIDVIPVNDPPAADSQSVETPEDTALAILLTGSDPENDTLVFSLVAGPDSGSLSGSPPDLVYTPNENFTGTDAFTFFTNDGGANSDPATVSIIITPVNDAPTADPQSISVDEDSSISFALTGSDVENDALSFALLDLPQHGAITLDGSTVTYTPSENYNGEDSLTFMTNDGDLDSAAAVVTISVDPVNDAPTIEALPDAARVEGEAFSATATASDIDGDTLAFSAEGLPAALTIDAATGVISGLAQAVGTHGITVSVSDPDGASASTGFTLLISPANVAPVANDQNLSADAGVATPVTLVGSDEDNDTLVYRIIDGPVSGTLTGDAPNVMYTSNPGFEGFDSFTFDVNDGTVDSNVATVTIEVTIPNRAPAIVSDPVTSIDEFSVYQYDVDANDPDGDVLTFAVDSPAGIPINGSTGELEASVSALAIAPQGLRASNDQCLIPPSTGVFDPVVEWEWTQSDVLSEFDQIMSVPLVAQVNDDNGDGVVSELDAPDIVVMTYHPAATGVRAAGIIRVFDGATGAELVTTDESHYLDGYGTLAVGDIDGDGFIEIVGPNYNTNGLTVFEHDGSVKYSTTGFEWTDLWGRTIALADLDEDGVTEIIAGFTILSADGTVLWQFDRDAARHASGASIASIADVDPASPGKEVIAGGSLYSSTGQLLWETPGAGPGFTAVADVTGDGEPEIVVISGGYISLVAADGSLVWGAFKLPTGGSGGTPTIADMDGDGFVEIGVAGADRYLVYNHDGSILWRAVTQDMSSGATGSTVFDFDGDGRAEVLYADEKVFRVYDGTSGYTLFEEPLSSGTAFEYPVVADVDQDGSAEIIVTSDQFLVIRGTEPPPGNNGLRVYGSASDSWMPTRSLWNQHAYSITNVNDDGTIPAVTASSWSGHNTFRLNTFADRNPLEQPDLALYDIALDEATGELSATAVNRGLAAVDEPVEVQILDGSNVVAQWTVNSLSAGEQVVLSESVDASALSDALTGAIDVDNAVAECIENNNTAQAAVIRVRATDPEGLFDVQTFTVAVENVNEPPAILTTSLGDAVEGVSYTAVVNASDPDIGDVIHYALVEAPPGMLINPASGAIYWPAAAVLSGTENVTVQVTDLGGLSASDSWTVTVSSNTPPQAQPLSIETLRDTQVSIVLSGTDADGDPLSISIESAPSHGSLTGVSPDLSYLPNAGFVGSDSFTYTVSDGIVSSSAAVVSISVVDDNTAPTITSTPVTTVEEGNAYSYAVTATDADGDTLSYALTQFPSGMSIDGAGLISWTPNSAQVGDNTVTAEVSDGRGGLDSQSFVVTVTEAQANRGPQVTSVPATFTKEGREYSYQMVATDPDGDALNYALINGPAGMAVDAAGLLTWTVGAEGEYPVTLRVDDAQAFVDQDWTLTVLPASTFDIYVSVDPVPLVGEPFTVSVTPINAAGPVVGAIDVAGQILMLDDELQATTTVDTPGDYTLSLTVSDDLDTIERDQPLSVLEALDPTAPTVTLATPDYDQIVTAPIDVIGSVQDTDLASWTLFAVEKGTTDAFILAEGTEPFAEQVIAQFDPTMLLNGMYTIELQATDTSANQAFDNRQVIVDGNMKVGNFSITFEDMTVPVSGIPITVTRTYDTRQSHKNMDFGYGWSVDYDNVRVHESRPLGLSWDLVEFDRGFFTDWCVLPNGNPVVTVTLPDGEVEKFQAKAQPECSPQQPEVNVQIVFEPIDGTDTVLEAPQLGLQKLVGGNLVDPGDSAVSADPQFYRLTTPEGYIYELNQGFTVNEVIDPNGNTLTFTENGIVHSSGENLEFVRDTQGRISQIIAPDGTTTNYDYTVEGDLERFRDQLDHGTEFAYLAQRAHYLEDIIDPRGIRVARNEYDDDGRLVAHIDADGNRIEYTHDIEGRQELIKDRRGNTMLYVYDDQGNVIAETNALNETTLREYDNDYNETAMVDPLDNRTEWTYDNRRNQTSETNALGEVTTSTYNGRNALLTQVDDAGVTVITNVYSSQNGELRSTTDALSNTTQFVYDSGIGSGETGELKSMTDAENNSMQYFINPITGRRDGEIDARGTSTSYFYDAMGRVERQVTNRTDALGSTVTLETTFVFDDKGNITQTTHPDGSITRIEYNEIDKPVAEIDANGNRTEMEYDERGNLALTRYADGSTETTEYDEEGNTIAQTDRAGRTTRMVYDAAGRMVETIYPDDTPLDDTDNPRTINEYDVAGRLEATVNERGFLTEYEYDAIGRRTLVRDALGNETTFEYNNRGHRTATVDARGKRTEFTYDDAGRLLRTTFHDGTFTETAYDGLGRKVSETDQAGLTTQFEYDEGGNLTAVVDALSQRTEYVYDEQSNKTIQRDAEGRETRWEYDDLGRVIARVLPEGQRESFTYDSAGNRISRTDFNGVTTAYTYDSLNRMTRTDYPDGTFVRTVYDVTGQVDFMEDHRGMTDYTYDVRDRLQRIDYPNGTYVEYGYDIAGNRIRLTTPNQQVIYTYDELNRLETVTDASGVATYGYDAVGNRDFTDYANGTRAEYVYDDLNRLLQLTNYDALGGIMTDHVYTLGNAGNRIQMAETLPTGARVVDYVYDDLYRLVEEQVTDPVHGDQTTTWTYDQVGNRQTQTVDDGTIVTTTYTYDDNDRLLTEVGTDSINYRYDANGNTLDKAVNGLVEVIYEYDYENRLIATDNATYAYDPSGIRQSKVENGQGVIYLVDPNRDYAQVIEEQDAMGQAQVIYSYGDDLLTQTRSEGTYQYHYDGLGSTRALSDVFGAESDSYIYSAFGELEEQAGTTPNTYLYTGEQFDPNLGWYYLRARYYNPANGRFLMMDAFAGYANDPRSLHKYTYAENDPVVKVDPSGYTPTGTITETMKGIQIGAILSKLAVPLTGITIGVMLHENANTRARAKQDALACAAAIANTSVGRNPCGLNPFPMVFMSFSRIPSVMEHVAASQAAGRPMLLHRTFSPLILWNRYRACGGGNGKANQILPATGSSCDEYPFASTYEGGDGSTTRYVPLTENLRQGGVLSIFYSLCGVQGDVTGLNEFIVVPVRNSTRSFSCGRF